MSVPRQRVLAALLSLVLALGSTPVFATPALTSTVDGRIFDSDLATPMPRLQVSAYAEGSAEPSATASTDGRGRFRLDGLSGGAYLLLLAEESGKPLAAAEIAMEAGRNQVVTLALPERVPASGALAPGAADDEQEEGEGEGEGSEAKGESRFGKWLKTPLGATIAILLSAVALSYAADEFTDENPRVPESNVLP